MTTYKTAQCHPRNKTRKGNTCYDITSLTMLRDLWNKRHPDYLISSMDSNTIWNELKNNIKGCTNEICWIDSNVDNDQIKKQLKRQIFAPIAPKSWNTNKNEWLSSVDIELVLEQYKEIHPEFNFMGPSPIDFDVKFKDKCVWNELCKLSVNEQKNNHVTKIGIVFNLDPHYKRGSHWVALYVDLMKQYVFYFDSCGNQVPKEIKELMNRIKTECDAMGYRMKLMDNVGMHHQKEDTECGMYVLYFIINMLEEIRTPKYFKTRRIPDKEMEMFRDIYFNKI